MRLLQKVDSRGKTYFEIRDARVMRRPFRNFGGRPSTIHPNGGVREFGVFLDDPEAAQQLAEYGFNVKTFTSRDGSDGDDQHWLSIKVKYYNRKGEPLAYPPIFVIRTANNVCYYEENNIKELDDHELENVNIRFYPDSRDVGGKHFETPYLNLFKGTLIEDDFFDDEFDDEGGLPFEVD